MIIHSIELKGHGSYREYTKVELPLGIVGILGQYDEDPLKSNGSGKSTLVMSVIYALFGEGEFKVIKELVNVDSTDGEMYVKIHFSLKGEEYFVERGIRNNASYLDFKENGVRKGNSDKIKLTQQEIINVLNMDYGMFTTSGFFEQNALDKFINTDPEILRRYIDKILGIELWRSVSKIAKKKSTKIDEKIGIAKTDVEKLEGVITNIEKELLEKVQVEADIIKVTGILVAERDSLSNLNVLKSKIDTLKEVKEKIKSLDGLIRISEPDVFKEKKRIEELKNHIVAKEKELSELELISEEKINEVEYTIDGVNRRILSYDEDFKKVKSKLSDAQGNLRFYEGRQGRLRAGKCSDCDQEITQEYIDKQAQVYAVEVKKYIKEVGELTEERDKFTRDIAELEDEISNLSDEVNRYRNINKNYKTNKILFTESIKSFQGMIEMAERSLEKLTKTLEVTANEKNELEIKSIALQKEIPEGIDDKILTTEYNIINSESQLNALNVELGKLEQMELAKNWNIDEVAARNKEIKELKKSFYIYSTLNKKYKDFARQKFENSIISIQNVANGIIHQIIPGMSVKIYEDDSKLKRVVIGFDVNGKDRSYKRLSGGQRTVANIALRLGFSKIVQARAKSNIGFVVLDEPFGSLDERNRELVSRMLTVMLEWFEQILVISHVENVKEFPNVISVGMTVDGVSYIK